MQEIFLKVDKLSKSYKEFKAVDEISLSVNKGEVFGLLGPNGAGKTSTIKMLCGLLKSDSGTITYNGISLHSDYKKVKKMIGLCPQEIVIWEQLTCLEQLKFAGMSYGLSYKMAQIRAEELLQLLGLWEKRKNLGRSLSGGMQRRLNIALALVHNPEFIILDEPQAGLDPQSKILVRDFIRHLAKEKTVILTTHDMDEADRVSERIGIIDHGKILVVDTPQKLKTRLGKGEILQIRVDNINNELADKVLNAMPIEVYEKKYTDGYLFLGAENILEWIPIVNNILESFSVHIIDMTIRKPTLEDAFISLTGRGLRE